MRKNGESTALLLAFYFILGLNFSLPAVGLQFYLVESIKMTPPAMASLMAVISIPWCFKPAVGLFSDTFTLFGLHRKPYIVIGLLVNGLSWWVLPHMGEDGIGLLLFTSSFGMCVADVACDCLLVVAARNEDEKNKGTVQSYAWGLRAAGGLAASLIGPVAYNSMGAQLTFILTGCVPIVFSTLIPLLNEEKHLHDHKIENPLKRLFEAFKNPIIWQPALFIVCLNITPGYGTVLVYFFEKVLGFTPYNFATLDFAGSVSAIVGTILYKRYLTRVPLRKLFFYTLAIAWVLRWLHLVLITRIAPGIDMAFAIGESIALTLVGQAILLPTVVMVAKICPPGIEGVLFATMMSLSNISSVASAEWGSVMAESMGITRTNFSGLMKLAVLCNIIGILPIFAVRLISKDLVDEEQKEQNTEDEIDATL